MPRPTPRWLDTARQRDVAWASLFVLILAVVGSAIAVSSRSHPPYHLGQTIDRPVLARVQFEAIDAEATDRRRDFARREVYPIFRHNDTLYQQVRGQVLGLLRLADEPFDRINPEYLDSIKLTESGYAVIQSFARSEDAQERTPAKWEERTERMLRDLFSVVILPPDELERAFDDSTWIKVVHPNPYDPAQGEWFLNKSKVYSLNNGPQIRDIVETDGVRQFPVELRETIATVVLDNLSPTYAFDPTATESRRMVAAEATPVVKIVYQPDQVLVPSGTQLGVDELKLIEGEYAAKKSQTPQYRNWLTYAGMVGLVMILGVGVWMYVFAYSSKIRRNPVRGLALTTLLLLCQGMAVVMVGIWPETAMGCVVFSTLFGAVILAIVYDQRFALAMGSALTILIVVSLRLPVGAAVVMMVGLCVAVAQLAEIRSRSKVVRVGLWSGVAMGLTTFIVGLTERSFDLPAVWTLPLINTNVSSQWGVLASDVLYSTLAGLLVGLLVQGLLPVIERSFHVTTAMTLKELNDASHPLLQRLAQESAGTYQHSLRIADMSEAAADAIAADGLLCRVGAMYHDIGKINKPQYFIENQGGGPNRHNKLSPAMSLLIIVGHVKDGIEMAREYNLPPVIRHFIESHHGTTLVEYFYHAAKKQTEAEDKPAPSEFEFRYPGPKPQTKEAAIMLLCDGIEGAARAMDEPTSVRLEQLVHVMANKRLMDGQFDECNMTLGELAKVEAAVTKTLCAVYHSRIKYPDGRKSQEPPTGAQVKLA